MTIKQLSNERAKFLSSLKFFKDNSIVAVNTQWMTDGETFCELYSRKTRKRVRIKTHILFDIEEFMKNPDEFMRANDSIKKIMIK
jgi:hypothetical protein